MNWRDTFRTAGEAVRTHRLRSALTMLGILIGISAVVLTVGLGEGAKAQVRDSINSLGTNLSLWESQLPAFSKAFRVLRYDFRGHGQTQATPGEYSIQQLAHDALNLLDALQADNVNFCGLSIGGLTGMSLGAAAPQRFNKLILSNTAPQIGTKENWNTRIQTVREHGTTSVSAAVIERG